MRTTLALAALAAGLAFAAPANAAPEPKNAEQQTPWKLYVDSKEAFAMKQEQGDKVLLVDVRDPIEIMFTGFATPVDVNVPYLSADPKAWNEKKSVFKMQPNADFEAQIAKSLADRGLSKDTPILLMCRSGGERGAPSAMQLWDKGYSKVYVVTDGFEGGTVKDGERKGWRLIDGWKNAGLPWSYKLDAAKFPFSVSVPAAKPATSN